MLMLAAKCLHCSALNAHQLAHDPACCMMHTQGEGRKESSDEEDGNKWKKMEAGARAREAQQMVDPGDQEEPGSGGAGATKDVSCAPQRMHKH